MPAAILGLTVGLLPFRGLPVSPLGFPVMMTPCRKPAFITAVGLPPETTTADTKKNVTPLTFDLTQQSKTDPLSDLQSTENRHIMLSSVVGLPGLVVQKKGPK